MPRRRKRGTVPGFRTEPPKASRRKGGGAKPPTNLAPGWKPGDRWGPGEHDVIPLPGPGKKPKGTTTNRAGHTRPGVGPVKRTMGRPDDRGPGRISTPPRSSTGRDIGRPAGPPTRTGPKVGQQRGRSGGMTSTTGHHATAGSRGTSQPFGVDVPARIPGEETGVRRRLGIPRRTG